MSEKLQPLVFYPDRRLMVKTDAVNGVGEQERKEFNELELAMHEYDGIGLAGPQIGIMKQMFVVNHDHIVLRRSESNRPLLGHTLFMANTVIIERSEQTQENQEGCLSLPGIVADVTRSNYIKASYLDYHGEAKVIEADGLLAACILHEHDHTHGRLILDYQSRLKRNMLERRIAKTLKDMA